MPKPKGPEKASEQFHCNKCGAVNTITYEVSPPPKKEKPPVKQCSQGKLVAYCIMFLLIGFLLGTAGTIIHTQLENSKIEKTQ